MVVIARQFSSDYLALVRGAFCHGVRKGKWKGTGMIGEGNTEGGGMKK